MHLDVAVDEERTRVDDLVPQREPGRPGHRGRRCGGIQDRRVFEVEAVRDVLHRLRDGGVGPFPAPRADDEEFVRVLVDRVRRLKGRGGHGEDEVHPGAVPGADGEVAVLLLDRVWVHEEEWFRVLQRERKAGLSENPAVRGIEVLDLEDVCLVGGWGGSLDGEGHDHGCVEEHCVCCGVCSDQVDVRLGGLRLGNRSIDVRHNRSSVVDLVQPGDYRPNGIVASRPIQLHEHRVPLSVGEQDGVNEYRLNVPAVDGIYVHRMLVD